MLLLLLACTAKTVPDAELHMSEDVDESATLYERDRMLEVSLTLDPDDWDELRFQSRDIVEALKGDCLAEPFPDAYSWFDADVTIDGETVEDVGLRKRGLLGSASTERPGLKIGFDKVVDDQTFKGLTRLTFTNAQQDPTLMHMCVTYDTFRAAGLPVPRCSYAHVTVNGEDLGAYVNIETFSETSLARYFDDPTGDLWEGTLSDFRDGWTGTFDPKDDDNDPATLHAVADALKAADDELLDQLDAVVDLDQHLRFWAVEMLTGHWDGYAGNTNNFLVYADPSDGRLRFLPWGADATWESETPFGAGVSAAVLVNAALPTRVVQTEEGRARFEAVYREVVEGFDVDAAVAEVDRSEALLTPYMDQGYDDAVAVLREVLRGRPERVLSELDDGLAYDGALRDDPCLVSHGEVVAEFTTTWGSYEAGDYYSGDVAITMTWDGTTYPTTENGGAVGEYMDQAFLVLLGELGGGAGIAPYVLFAVEDVAPGEVPLAGTSASLLYRDDIRSQYVQAAYLGDGAITFSEAGTSTGDAVTGTLTAELYAGGP